MTDVKQLTVGSKWTDENGIEFTVVDVTTNKDGEVVAVESIGVLPQE